MSFVCCLIASHRPSVDPTFPYFDFEPTDTSAGCRPWLLFFLEKLPDTIPFRYRWGDSIGPVYCWLPWGPGWAIVSSTSLDEEIMSLLDVLLLGPVALIFILVVFAERDYVMYFVRWIILRVFWFHCIRSMYWHSVGLCLWAFYYSILRVLLY